MFGFVGTGVAITFAGCFLKKTWRAQQLTWHCDAGSHYGKTANGFVLRAEMSNIATVLTVQRQPAHQGQAGEQQGVSSRLRHGNRLMATGLTFQPARLAGKSVA